MHIIPASVRPSVCPDSGGGGNGIFPIWPKFPAEFECARPSPRLPFPALPLLPSAAVSVNGPTECPERWRRRCRRPDRLKGREKGKGNFIQKGGFPLPLSPANSVQASGDARTKFYSLRFQPKMKKTPSSRLSRPTPSHGCSQNVVCVRRLRETRMNARFQRGTAVYFDQNIYENVKSISN